MESIGQLGTRISKVRDVRSERERRLSKILWEMSGAGPNRYEMLSFKEGTQDQLWSEILRMEREYKLRVDEYIEKYGI